MVVASPVITEPSVPEPIVAEEHRDTVTAFLWQIFVGLSLLLLAGSIFRAVTYPFVHDESLSFAIFTFEPRFAQTANHHLLNTWAMEACARFFGNAEWALRLPNLLGHLAYLGAVLALLRRLRPPAVQICAFVALNLNPFVLDFFFLARGYGMGLAALLISLALFARASEEQEIARRRRWLLAALGAGGIAVLANFAFLFFYLTLHGVVGSLYFPRGARHWDWKAAGAVALDGIFLFFAVSRIRVLSLTGGLYFGGTHGFFQDTAGSLIESTIYRVAYPSGLVTAAVVVVAGMFAAAIGAGAWLAVRERRFTHGLASTALLTGTALLPILSHAFGQSLLPVERAAVPYLPLGATAFVFALSDVWRARPAKWVARGVAGGALLLAIAGIAHFAMSYNVFTCYVWPYDANDKAALSLLLRDQQMRGVTTPPRLTVSWIFLPTFSFYRATGPGQWLAPVQNLRYRSGNEDYAYVLESDAAPLLAKKYGVLARFADTQTVLLRRP